MSALKIAIAALKADSGVAAKVGTKIHAVLAPQKPSAPYIVLNLLSEDDEQMLQGAGQWPTSRIEVACMAASGADANTLGEAVKTALQNLTNQTIAGKTATVMKGNVDFTDASDDRSIYRRVIEFDLRWR